MATGRFDRRAILGARASAVQNAVWAEVRKQGRGQRDGERRCSACRRARPRARPKQLPDSRLLTVCRGVVTKNTSSYHPIFTK